MDISTEGTIAEGSYFTVTYKGARSKRIAWTASAIEFKNAIESISSINGDVCVSRALSPNALNAGGYRWMFRFEDISEEVVEIDVDDGGLEFVEPNGGFLSAQIVTTNIISSDWVSVDGDMSMCTARSATYVGGSGTTELHFEFQVLPGDSAERLDISDYAGSKLLFPSPKDNISLLINSPGTSTITVDPNLESRGLESDQNIEIDSTPPAVAAIAPQQSTTPDGSYAVGDTLFFEISFDKPVEVST